MALIVVGLLNVYYRAKLDSSTCKIPHRSAAVGNETCHKKKVVSFVLFNKNGMAGGEIQEWLMIGLEANRLGWRFYLPDWIMRVYIGPGISEKIGKRLTAIAANDPKFEISILPLGNVSDIGQPQNFHQWMLYRFMVADDPAVERFIVRDLDGRPSIRELLAINDWIRSGRSFHTIRDHKWHSKPIMGGMWGATDQMFPQIRKHNRPQSNANAPDRVSMRNLITDFVAKKRGTLH